MYTYSLPIHARALKNVLGYSGEKANLESAQPAVDHFTIAISREAGTPEAEVAREIGARLGWPIHDHELPESIARELNLPLAVVEHLDERPRHWLLECLASFGPTPTLTEGRYFRHLLARIRSLGEQGRCVIVGRGAAYILPPAMTLRVRLVGDREDRIAAFCRRFRFDWQTAAHRLDEIHREQVRFIHEHFHAEPGKTRHYDLVLNTSQWSPSDCADFVLAALHHKAGRPLA